MNNKKIVKLGTIMKKPNVSKFKVEEVRNIFETFKILGYLVFCLMIVLSGLMIFGASIKYHFLFSIGSNQLIYFLLQSGFFISVMFIFICYFLAPAGYLFFFCMFRLLDYIENKFSKKRIIIEKEKFIKLIGDKFISESYEDEIGINIYVKKRGHNKKFSNTKNFLPFNIWFLLLSFIVGTTVSIVFLYPLYDGRIEDIALAIVCMSITIPVINIAVTNYYKNIKLAVILCIATLLYAILISDSGEKLFNQYMKTSGNLIESPTLIMDKSCANINQPIFNQVESSIIITSETSLNSKIFKEINNKYFKSNTAELQNYLESYSILQSDKTNSYVQLYDNKLLYIYKKNKSIDLSDCATVKILN
ncbi:MAG: hypothetical protein EKK57_03105 [Proteobacteria bacterium]|nr:MAG: hypothetical protein EKK57_03105 [Pseudomonadota bacterium]